MGVNGFNSFVANRHGVISTANQPLGLETFWDNSRPLIVSCDALQASSLRRPPSGGHVVSRLMGVDRVESRASEAVVAYGGFRPQGRGLCSEKNAKPLSHGFIASCA